MVLEVYPDAVSAGAAVFDRYDKVADPATGKKLSRTGWLALCMRAVADAAVGELVRAVFSYHHSV
ncbi:hypothetical protein [Mycolicibacterium sp.]|uniref:hypothetical protein n=1 Tax=Mycolicibacterium sp. TaxID=2320850 RepID=UPI0025E6CE3C|nr:hypothetical protein [Mycolicibacterium sp.]MCB9409367.1 hypothetical protein [Mycolicibacterium sp.]